ncbi:MAG TPA: signal peptidase II [Methylococcaceae bacterium]|nr:signal peptidase II [Methylococcaceae bacterium]
MLRWLWLSALVLVLDQVSKLWVDHAFRLHESLQLTPFFNLTYLRNTGAAFSFLGDAGGWQRWLFMGLALAASVLLGWWLWTLQCGKRLEAAGIALILGGALGNLIDRTLYGYVIDFFDFHVGTWHFAAFNVADSAITVGVGLLLLDSLLNGAEKEA